MQLRPASPTSSRAPRRPILWERSIRRRSSGRRATYTGGEGAEARCHVRVERSMRDETRLGGECSKRIGQSPTFSSQCPTIKLAAIAGSAGAMLLPQDCAGRRSHSIPAWATAQVWSLSWRDASVDLFRTPSPPFRKRSPTRQRPYSPPPPRSPLSPRVRDTALQDASRLLDRLRGHPWHDSDHCFGS
jgi:hypothetical protein